jgi:hypothetical protein
LNYIESVFLHLKSEIDANLTFKDANLTFKDAKSALKDAKFASKDAKFALKDANFTFNLMKIFSRIPLLNFI